MGLSAIDQEILRSSIVASQLTNKSGMTPVETKDLKWKESIESPSTDKSSLWNAFYLISKIGTTEFDYDYPGLRLSFTPQAEFPLNFDFWFLDSKRAHVWVDENGNPQRVATLEPMDSTPVGKSIQILVPEVEGDKLKTGLVYRKDVLVIALDANIPLIMNKILKARETRIAPFELVLSRAS